MKKVYFNPLAKKDLRDIFIGLLKWKKVELSREEARQYVSDIYNIALSLPYETYHQKCKYLIHLKYGNYQYLYQRNKHTMWYIIYNIDIETNSIYIEKIMNNYLTI